MREENKKQKGALFGLPFFMIIGLIVVVSAWLFFIFFKVHITSIAVDVDSINRYQEIPTAVLGTSVIIGPSLAEKSQHSVYSDGIVAAEKEIQELESKSGGPSIFEQGRIAVLRGNIESYSQKLTELPPEDASIGTNCFNGDGPAGPHGQNDHLCMKRLAFYYTKFANNAGIDIFSNSGDTSSTTKFVAPSGVEGLIQNMRTALPTSCYKFSFESDGNKPSVLSPLKIQDTGVCSLDFPKLNEVYPMPIFLGGKPAVAIQRVLIGSSTTSGKEILVNWPRYDTCFLGQNDCADKTETEGSEATQPTVTDSPPEVKVGHMPLAPTSAEAVTVNADVSDDIGLKSVEMFFDGKSLGLCHYVGSKTGVCTKSAAGHVEGTSHEYYAKLTDSSGQVTTSATGSFVIAGAGG